MLTALVHVFSRSARLIVIVALSVMAGLAVALACRNVEGDVLQILALFATFAAPVSVAWMLFRMMPPVSSRANRSPVVRVLDNDKDSQDGSSQRPQGSASPGQPTGEG